MTDLKIAGPPPPYTKYPTGSYPAAPPRYSPPYQDVPPQGFYPSLPPQGYALQEGQQVVVMEPVTRTIIVERQGVNHVLHCLITLFFWPWIIVWFIMCIMDA